MGTVAHIFGVLAEHLNEVGDVDIIHFGIGLREKEALRSIGVEFVVMVGPEAVLHLDLAVLGLVVDISVVTIGDIVA